MARPSHPAFPATGGGSPSRASVEVVREEAGGAEWPSWFWLGLAAVVFWWIDSLRPQWRDLVEYQHGWLVFPLAAYLAWERWERRPPASPPSRWGWAAGGAALAIPLVLVAELYRQAVGLTASASFAASVGCGCFVFGSLWLRLGLRSARWFLLPLMFVFTAVPLPKLLWNPVVLGLQGMVTAINLEALHLFGVPATRQGNTLHLATGVVGVDEACSGIRSLQATVMVALFVGDLTFRRAGTKILFLLAGVGLAFLGNLLRSLALSLTAARGGVDALNRVHDATGWTVLAFTLVSLTLLAWWVARAETARESKVQPDHAPSGGAALPEVPGTEPGMTGPVARSGYAVWVLLFLGLGGAVAGAWGWFHLAPPAERAGVRLNPRASLAGWAYVPEEIGATARAILATTNLVQGRYLPREGSTNRLARVSVFAAEWRARDGQAMGVVQHTPDICWVGGGWVPVALGQPNRVAVDLSGQSLSFECRAFAAPGGGTRELVLWCTLVSGEVFEERDRWAVETDAAQPRAARMDWVARRNALGQFADNVAARRPATGEKQFVRFSAPVQEDWAAVLERLRGFAGEWLAVEHQALRRMR